MDRFLVQVANQQIFKHKGILSGIRLVLSARRVGVLCSEGRIPDVQKTGNTWLIPENAEKPADARIKSGKYIKSKIETEEQAE